MNRTRNVTITAIASALVVAAVVAPSAGASERTATELGQSAAPPSSATPSGGDPSERTATELGQAVDEPAAGNAISPDARTVTELSQAVGEPGDGGDKFARTSTELGQSTNLSASPTPSGESDGFDWGPVAIAGGSVLGLTLMGLGVIALGRRRGTIRKSRAPAVSS
jgi:hypothetical protein